MAKHKRRARSNTRKEEDKRQIEKEIEDLSRRVIEEAPKRGYAPPLQQPVAFRALPLSEQTLRGLEDSKKTPFTTMTDIQNACIPHALAGRDILGAARTGSGKTLAFLIPVLEDLYRNRFTTADGPGAAILSPTRELAVQIFQVLKQAGKYHSFGVGLLIGGRQDFYEEQQHVAETNILIATPGRLLQHLEQTPYFELGMLRILVLDEADRILDMGFREQLVRILDYLPADRQTLLFSATQTRDVSQLATLSLKKPEYLGVHDKESTSTPASLQQSYVVVPLEHKLNAVYSFIKSHLKSKSIIFMSTCAQVRFAWELFCSLRPGLPVLALHGKLVQRKRTQIYFDYCQRPHAVMFSTDVAARGLDFPDIDWVVQVDAPEDVPMYIHRVGRTARYRKGGKALLMLTPGETKNGFVKLLQEGKSQIPIKRLAINPSKTVVVNERAASLIASKPDLNLLAKKSFQSYVRSITLMPLKDIFRVGDYDLDQFAASLGLALTPNLRFLKETPSDREARREKKNVNRKLQKLKEQIKAEKLAKKLSEMGEVKPANGPKGEDSDQDDIAKEDDLLVPKKKQSWKNIGEGEGEGESDDEDLPDVHVHQVTQSRKTKKIRIEGSTSGDNSHVRFGDDGQAQGDMFTRAEEQIQQDKDNLAQATNEYMAKVRDRLRSSTDMDKAAAKERVREKHKKRKLKLKAAREGDVAPGEQAVATLAVPEDDDTAVESEPQGDDIAGSPSEGDGDDSDSSLNSGDEDTVIDVAKQEQMALSLIRGN